MGLRGALDSALLRRVVLKGARSRVLGAGHVRGTGVLKLEEDVVLQGHSQRGVTLGAGVSLGAFSQLRPSSYYGGLLGEGCDIGAGTTFGPYAYIGCGGMIRIGKNCMFGPRVSLIAENHVITPAGVPLKGAGVTRAGIQIGDDCWFGANVVVVDGARIGDGVIVAAGAVVRGEVPPNSIVGGVPARLLRSR
jgi:acetyltransferase-like isoleucine patch superfamily enzyme